MELGGVKMEPIKKRELQKPHVKCWICGRLPKDVGDFLENFNPKFDKPWMCDISGSHGACICPICYDIISCIVDELALKISDRLKSVAEELERED